MTMRTRLAFRRIFRDFAVGMSIFALVAVVFRVDAMAEVYRVGGPVQAMAGEFDSAPLVMLAGLALLSSSMLAFGSWSIRHLVRSTNGGTHRRTWR